MELAQIQEKIYEIRGQKVMFDFDLAKLYDVETRVLKQSVKRNIERFPSDFMFELTETEIELMVSQFVIPSKSHFGGAKPFVFTEQGVSMLSAFLKSKKALIVSISIIRVFIELKKMVLSHKEILEKLKLIETKYDKQLDDVFEAINYLLKKITWKNKLKVERRLDIRKLK